MNEWNVVLALSVVVGLFFTVGNPIIKLNSTVTKLNESLKATQRDHEKFEQDAEREHRDLWDHNDKQDEILEQHKMRLHDLDGK